MVYEGTHNLVLPEDGRSKGKMMGNETQVLMKISS